MSIHTYNMVTLIHFSTSNRGSIIDYIELNCCVRNGNRCFPYIHQHHRIIHKKKMPKVNNNIIYYVSKSKDNKFHSIY